MHDNTAVQMMRRCLETIEDQRARIAHLTPKAEAYDRIGILLEMVNRGNRQLVGGSEDVAWQLRREIEIAEERMRAEKRGQDTRRPVEAEPQHVAERDRRNSGPPIPEAEKIPGAGLSDVRYGGEAE